MNARKSDIKYPRKWIWIKSAIAIAIIVAAVFMFLHAGDYLVIKNEPVKADAIVVLMGSVGDRAYEAYELYSSGFADRILLAEDHEIGRKSLIERGIHLPNDADKTKEILLELGVPDSIIHIIPGDNQSTKEEARQVGLFIENEPGLDTLLLVTSASHSRRAVLYFAKVVSKLPHPVKILSCPSRYSEFEPGRWWADRGSAKQIAYEYSRLAYFCFWDRF